MGHNGYQRFTAPQAGYAGNLMAEWGGTLGWQNVVAMDVDQKIQSIHDLQNGWITGQDMAAIGRICASVIYHDDAEAIRKAVDLSSFSDLGQRTQMRVLLGQMP
ncbi:MAG: hypothetical protein M3O46_05560 [Myxococcota bacterium]|nr:hypothetical protein [Myxococcota bacterium]